MADAKLPFFLLCEKKLFAYLDSQLTLQQHLEEDISFSHEEKSIIYGEARATIIFFLDLSFSLFFLFFFLHPLTLQMCIIFKRKGGEGKRRCLERNSLVRQTCFFHFNKERGGSAIRQTVLVFFLAQIQHLWFPGPSSSEARKKVKQVFPEMKLLFQGNSYMSALYSETLLEAQIPRRRRECMLPDLHY